MKAFAIEPSMLTLRGVFYPTGYMFVMFPTEKIARDAEHALEQNGFTGEKISLLTPEDIQQKIAHTIADISLPSAGTEADTVRHFAELASQGHYAVVADDHEAALAALKDAGFDPQPGSNAWDAPRWFGTRTS